jgi:hypothetical protein
MLIFTAVNPLIFFANMLTAIKDRRCETLVLKILANFFNCEKREISLRPNVKNKIS